MRTLRGIAFQEVTPEYNNLHGAAINIATLARWDPDNVFSVNQNIRPLEPTQEPGER